MRTDSAHRRGARVLRAQDWPFGSVGRRKLLEFVLHEAPDPPWTKRLLEEAAGTTNRGVDDVLAGLVYWELLEQRADGFWPVRSGSALAEALVSVLGEVSGDESPIPPIAPGRRGRPSRSG